MTKNSCIFKLLFSSVTFFLAFTKQEQMSRMDNETKSTSQPKPKCLMDYQTQLFFVLQKRHVTENDVLSLFGLAFARWGKERAIPTAFWSHIMSKGPVYHFRNQLSIHRNTFASPWTEQKAKRFVESCFLQLEEQWLSFWLASFLIPAKKGHKVTAFEQSGVDWCTVTRVLFMSSSKKNEETHNTRSSTEIVNSRSVWE